MSNNFGDTESRVAGERRPKPFTSYKRKNRPFSTAGFTDPRSKQIIGDNIMNYKVVNNPNASAISVAGSYSAVNLDNARHAGMTQVRKSTRIPLISVWKKRSITQTSRERASNDARSDYNKAYGPGASSSIPPVKKARIKLASAIGKRKV